MPDIDALLQRLIGGDPGAAEELRGLAPTSTDARLLVAAALVTDPSRRPSADELLARAARHATATRDRQLVAVAAAYVEGDHERLDALVRDHLADHPDNVLAAWIAARADQPHLRP